MLTMVETSAYMLFMESSGWVTTPGKEDGHESIFDLHRVEISEIVLASEITDVPSKAHVASVYPGRRIDTGSNDPTGKYSWWVEFNGTYAEGECEDLANAKEVAGQILQLVTKLSDS